MNFEFLQGVDRRKDHVTVEVDVGVLHAVQREVIVLAAQTNHGKALLDSRATLTAIAGNDVAKVGDHVGTQRYHLKVVASVQGQIHDALILDDRPDSGILGL